MDVIVYTAPGCHYCSIVKEFLSDNDIGFEEKDASEDDVREELIELTDHSSVPSTYIVDGDDEHVVIGYNKESLSNVLGL